MSNHHEGQQCVSLGYMRQSDSRVAPTMRLIVQDSEMKIISLLDLDAKQFADLLSGLATWVDDGLAQEPS